MSAFSVSVSDGKYTVIHDGHGSLTALRYGEAWRNLVGDNLVMSLATELHDARDAIAESRKQLKEAALMLTYQAKPELVVARITKFLKGAEQPGDWQPIETAPHKHGEQILVFDEDRRIGYWSDNRQCFRCEITGGPIHPTHWMPLPQPPQ